MAKTALIDLRTTEAVLYTAESGPLLRSAAAPANNGAFSIDIPAGSDCCLSLPLSLLDFRVIELPFGDAKKIRELLPFELDSVVLGGSRNVVFDLRVLESAGGRTRVLVAYVRKDLLSGIIDRLRAAGAEPRSVFSIELSAALAQSAGNGDVAGRLLSSVPPAEKERLSVAEAEMRRASFEFRRADLAYTVDAEQARRRVRRTLLLAALLAVVVAADLVIGIVAAGRENSAARDEIRRTYASLFPEEKKVSNELYRLKAHIKELKDKESAFVGAAPLQVLLDLSKSVRRGATLSEVNVERELITLRGECPTLGDVQKVKADLEAVFAGVTIVESKSTAQNRAAFTITAKGRRQ